MNYLTGRELYERYLDALAKQTQGHTPSRLVPWSQLPEREVKAWELAADGLYDEGS